MWKRRHVWSWLLKRRKCLTLLEDLACWRRTRSRLGCDARGYLATHQYLGHACQLGLLSTWQTDHHRPPSRWTTLNLLAFNFEAWKTIILERGLDQLSLRRSAQRPKIGRRQSLEEAQLAKTCYSLLQFATIYYNLPQLATTGYNLLQLATTSYN